MTVGVAIQRDRTQIESKMSHCGCLGSKYERIRNAMSSKSCVVPG